MPSDRLDANLPAASSSRQRFESIDVLRGLVIALMVLDHTRDFFHDGAFTFRALDVDKTTVATYATRWLTHLCAPTFVFLAGVSASLRGRRAVTRRELSLYLLTRGLWLVVLELTVIHWFGWWFNITLDTFGLTVIWALGASMVCLAGLIWLPRTAIAGVGLALVLGHNLLDGVAPADWGSLAPLWRILHVQGHVAEWKTIHIYIAYPLIPWIGVMAVGYAFGPFALAPVETRRRLLRAIGLASLILFLALRLTNLYGDPKPWTQQDGPLASVGVFLDVEKYPPSLCYLLVTLGLAFLLWRTFERSTPRCLRFLRVFGATPLFIYLLHLPLIHLLSAALHAALRGDGGWLFGDRYLSGEAPPIELGFSLPLTFAVWAVVLVALYPACRWLEQLKRRRRDWWLSYV